MQALEKTTDLPSIDDVVALSRDDMAAVDTLISASLATDVALVSQVSEYIWLRLLLHLSTGVIWFAFAAEFILMVSVAERKIAYCLAHWIDLAIIVLPLLSKRT